MAGKKESVLYDSRTNRALASDQQHHDKEQLKDMISRVKEVVSSRSNDDIVLVLQYYDYDVTQTINAFMEDGASEALKEWICKGNVNRFKPNNKNKKKKKKKTKKDLGAKSQLSISQSIDISSESDVKGRDLVSEIDNNKLENGDADEVSDETITSDVDRSSHIVPSELVITSCKDNPLPTELHQNTLSEPMSTTFLSETSQKTNFQRSTKLETVDSTIHAGHQTEAVLEDMHETERIQNVQPEETTNLSKNISQDLTAPRNRQRSTNYVTSTHLKTTSTPENTAVQPNSGTSTSIQTHGHRGLEKSLKDLSRQTVALQRVQNLLEEEIENSYRRIRNAFNEVQKHLAERQAELETEMEKVKKDAKQLLTQRQEMGASLKTRTDRASSMSEVELNELRADIKHFVVERKYDEELGKTLRFVWDRDRIVEEIKKFGEIHHVKNLYGHRRHSLSSATSSIAVDNNLQEDAAGISGVLSSDRGSACTASNKETPAIVQSVIMPPVHYLKEGRPRIFSNTERRFGNYQNDIYHLYGSGRGRGSFSSRGRGQQNRQDNRTSGGLPQRGNYNGQGGPLRTEGRSFTSQQPRGRRSPRRDRFPRSQQNFAFQSEKQIMDDPRSENLDNGKPNPADGSELINGVIEH
ncbi:spermatogenesis-associated serine-rich protein 2-like isoform X1 [Tachypleus tridentatus]|uniref:spermatogenesis-associated serine-rich protein 2-like isoform X1 n=1 Tax=Tachypleus tridentatus TaxID=6853 RepID=UPI003FD4317E